MIWQSYEKHNMLVLDEPMAEQLNLYLENKESQLSTEILEVILHVEDLPALAESIGPSSIKLSEIVEEFGKKVNRAEHTLRKAGNRERWKVAGKEINEALWSYVEILEGCVIELFQQIEQIGFEQWNVDLIRVITSIKDELTHRMDDLVWGIRRLEQQLKNYRWICEKREGCWGRFLKKIVNFPRILDRSLESTVRKCNKFLNFQYRKFVERYTGYLQLYEGVNQSMSKFYHYPVLSSMEIDQQDKLKHLYFLLKLWEKNQKARMLPRTESIRAVRGCLPCDTAIALFKGYVSSLRHALLDKSRMIKKMIRLIFNDKQSKQPLADNIASYRAELKMLKELMSDFKKFHQQTDPGAKNWFKRFLLDEPQKQRSKPFKDIEKIFSEIRKLEAWAVGFQSSLEKDSFEEGSLTPQLQEEVNRCLHEMGQPLASRNLMQRHAKVLLGALQSLDELASFDPQVVDFMGRTLCKAMCLDWKYQVLQEIPVFHRLYEVHHGICHLPGDRQHINRLHKFQRILNQIDSWIKNEEALKHAQEIDSDIHDIKAYLQDFLAYIQRLEKEDKVVWDNEQFERPVSRATQALLEYLYLFGRFFSKLLPDNAEHRMLRKQLLFIDQYFEAIDRQILELSKPKLPPKS